MQDDLKKQAAQAALDYLDGVSILGVGTGSTVNHFIDLLAHSNHKIEAAVSSSMASTDRLRAHGIAVCDLNEYPLLDVYVDGADEVNPELQLIKGGGGALTREKIIAAASKKFVCIADVSKRVSVLGKFPLPVEVIPMARAYVAGKLAALGGKPVWREGVLTDNGNVILDVHGLQIEKPADLEATINGIAGVVCVGLFADRPADVVLLAAPDGIVVLP